MSIVYTNVEDMVWGLTKNFPFKTFIERAKEIAEENKTNIAVELKFTQNVGIEYLLTYQISRDEKPESIAKNIEEGLNNLLSGDNLSGIVRVLFKNPNDTESIYSTFGWKLSTTSPRSKMPSNRLAEYQDAGYIQSRK